MTIVYWAAGWLAGIWLASHSSIPAGLWLVIALLGVLAAVLWRARTAVLLPLLICAAAALGGLRYELARPLLGEGHIVSRNDSGEVTVTGWVSRPAELGDTSQLLTLRVESVSAAGSAPEPLQGLLQVRLPRYPVQPYGARLQLTGKLQAPSAADAQFDYAAYLARKDIFSVMAFPQVTHLTGERGSDLMRGLTAVRERAQQAINRMLPEPQAALLSGILLGDDAGLPNDLQEDFRSTGMTHIIAISGFNIAIIAGLLLQAGRLVAGRRLAATIALTGVVLYTILVGAEASVVRAAIMGLLVITAVQFLGRPTYAPAALGSAAFFMTLANPDVLWDVGFQLSMAATLGLMTAVGPAQRLLEQRFEAQFDPAAGRNYSRFLSEIVLTTLAAFLFTLPVLLYHFGTVSIVALPANFLLLPVQAWLMLWGGAATLLGMIHPLLGQLPAWVSWLFLTYTIAGVRFFAGLPVTTVPAPLPATAVPLVAGALAAAVWLLRRPRRTLVAQESRFLPAARYRGVALSATAVLAVLLLATMWRAPDGRLHVAFLDVGQGDAILIQTPGGRQMLVDGGAYPGLLLGQLGERLPYWDRHLDVVLATHPDTDHVAGLAELLARYQVGQFIGSSMESAGSPAYAALLQTSSQRRIPCHVAQPGEVIRLDEGVTLTVLHAAGSGQGSDNDNSIVLALQYGALSVLLTGDSAALTEQELLRDGRLAPATVLKAGHHGARTSTSDAFLRAVRPAYVVISAGRDNRYGHPHPETLERIARSGAALLRTDEMGTLELISDGTRLWWR